MALSHFFLSEKIGRKSGVLYKGNINPSHQVLAGKIIDTNNVILSERLCALEEFTR